MNISSFSLSPPTWGQVSEVIKKNINQKTIAITLIAAASFALLLGCGVSPSDSAIYAISLGVIAVPAGEFIFYLYAKCVKKQTDLKKLANERLDDLKNRYLWPDLCGLIDGKAYEPGFREKALGSIKKVLLIFHSKTNPSVKSSFEFDKSKTNFDEFWTNSFNNMQNKSTSDLCGLAIFQTENGLMHHTCLSLSGSLLEANNLKSSMDWTSHNECYTPEEFTQMLTYFDN